MHITYFLTALTCTHALYPPLPLPLPPAVMSDLFRYQNPKNGLPSPMISQETFDVVQKHADVGLGCLLFFGHLCALCACVGSIVVCCLVAQTFNSAIIYDRDYGYSYFGFKVTCPTHHLFTDPSHTQPTHTLLPFSDPGALIPTQG